MNLSLGLGFTNVKNLSLFDQKVCLRENYDCEAWWISAQVLFVHQLGIAWEMPMFRWPSYSLEFEKLASGHYVGFVRFVVVEAHLVLESCSSVTGLFNFGAGGWR